MPVEALRDLSPTPLDDAAQLSGERFREQRKESCSMKPQDEPPRRVMMVVIYEPVPPSVHTAGRPTIRALGRGGQYIRTDKPH